MIHATVIPWYLWYDFECPFSRYFGKQAAMIRDQQRVTNHVTLKLEIAASHAGLCWPNLLCPPHRIGSREWGQEHSTVGQLRTLVFGDWTQGQRGRFSDVEFVCNLWSWFDHMRYVNVTLCCSGHTTRDLSESFMGSGRGPCVCRVYAVCVVRSSKADLPPWQKRLWTAGDGLSSQSGWVDDTLWRHG